MKFENIEAAAYLLSKFALFHPVYVETILDEKPLFAGEINLRELSPWSRKELFEINEELKDIYIMEGAGVGRKGEEFCLEIFFLGEDYSSIEWIKRTLKCPVQFISSGRLRLAQ